MTEQTQSMTPEQYLAWEQQQPIKYEYINGEVYGMTRETFPHNNIVINLVSALKSHLQGKNCKVEMADTKVAVSSNSLFFYPDVVVSCDPRDRESRNIIYYPCLIVEVLSPSTEALDRGKKLEHYCQIESLKEYVLIDSEKICIECYQRNEKNQWEATTYTQEFSVKLESINFEFTTSLLYEKKETPEKQTRLIRRFSDWWETTPIEKFIEDIDYFLVNLAVLNVVSLLANITLIVGLVGWLTGFEKRKEEKLFSTWSIINDAEGDQSGVVKTAVERLHKEKLNLSFLELNKTDLSRAKLSQARLEETNFSETELHKADFSKANLLNVNFNKAIVVAANFSEAFLGGTDFNKAYVNGADFSKANLVGAIFHEANLGGADFSEAEFKDIDLSGANLRGAKIFNAKNLSNAQIKLACNWKEATYVNTTILENNEAQKLEEQLLQRGKQIDAREYEYKWVPEDKQANQQRIKEIEQDKDSDPEIPPDCSKWEKEE